MQPNKSLDWYRGNVRPLLSEFAPSRLPGLDDDARRLEQLTAAPNATTVCVLGNAGIGKSTLINALVAGNTQVLPAGGIGPLTAQATSVRYGDMASFRVTYHRPKYLSSILRRVQNELVKRRRAEGLLVAENADEINLAAVGLELEGAEPNEMLTIVEEDVVDSELENEAIDETSLDLYKKVLRQLIAGDQNAESDESYVVDIVRRAMGNDPIFGHEVKPEDEARFKALKRALGFGRRRKSYELESASGDRRFREELRAHASGALAPIIEEISVQWPSEMLRNGLEVVDLPGVGIASDAHREKTQLFVRSKARVVMLVVDRAGVTDAALDLLRSSGYWDRLIGSIDDPTADPCTLLVAVTKLDQVAEEEYRSYSGLSASERPKKALLLERNLELAEIRIRQQTSEQLEKLALESEGTLRDLRGQAAKNLLANLLVCPVASTEYAKLLIDDEDDRPSIVKTVEQTGVPRLQGLLMEVAAGLNERRTNARMEVQRRLVQTASSALAELHYSSTDERLEVDVKRLRDQLESLVGGKREDAAARYHRFREYLENGVPDKIPGLVAKASAEASNQTKRELKKLKDVSWNTLAATVRRGGEYVGSRKIDLPLMLALSFQEPMVGLWGTNLLADIRKRTHMYASDCETIVREVCNEARQLEGKVSPRVIDGRLKDIALRVDRSKEVGKEAANEMRNRVRDELQSAVKDPIAKACRKFVNEGKNAGVGVKKRILDMFDELAEQAALGCEGAAQIILGEAFDEVRSRISENIDEWGDPVDETLDALTQSHARKLKKNDAARRERLEAALRAAREAAEIETEESVAA